MPIYHAQALILLKTVPYLLQTHCLNLNLNLDLN